VSVRSNSIPMPNPLNCLLEGGETGALMRSMDWSRTPIGPVEFWPLALQTMVRVLLDNRLQMLIWWGPQFCQLYNDAFAPALGAKHPRSMGQPASQYWAEVWHIIGSLIEKSYRYGEASLTDALCLEINRHGFAEETYWTIALSPIPDDTMPNGIGGVLGTVNEITEKVLAERRIRLLDDLGARALKDETAEKACVVEGALRASEEKYRALYESIDEGFCTIEVLFDEHDNPVDYRFLEVNPSFEKQTGIKDAQGRRMREIAPAHEDHWFEIYGKIALTGVPMRFENSAAQLNRWYDVYAFRVGEPRERKVAILFNDITARKQAETEMLALKDELAAELSAMTHLHEFSTGLLSKTEFEPTLQRALDAIISLQEADLGMIQFHNPATHAWEIVAQHGFNQDFLDHFNFVHEVSTVCGRLLRRKERAIIEDVLTDPEFAHRGMASSAGFRALQSTPLFNRAGEIVGTISTQFRQPHRTSDRDLRFTDLYARHVVEIMERKQTEDTLRAMQADLTHVTRVLSMGELTSSIVHEINQPLTVIVANANACQRLLQAEKMNLEEIRAGVTDIVAAGQKAAEVIAQIHSLLKKRTPERVPLNVNELMREVFTLIHHLLEKHKIAISAHLALELPRVVGDRIQLEQVVLNLMMNGIEAMISVDDRPRVLTLRSGEDGVGNVHVEIEDSGKGFLTANGEQIFDTFFTTKPGGMGMGLSISRSIITSHGGRLWGTANVERPGATFQFSLPGVA
jgi:PAS domain S-box-containing protein